MTYRAQVNAAERRALRKAKHHRSTSKQSEKSWKRSPLLWRSDDVVTAAAYAAATPSSTTISGAFQEEGQLAISE